MIKINELSKIGIGTYRMNSDNPQHKKSLKYAIESGINIIDTASNYNYGKSEKLVGSIVNKNFRKKYAGICCCCKKIRAFIRTARSVYAA